MEEEHASVSHQSEGEGDDTNNMIATYPNEAEGIKLEDEQIGFHMGHEPDAKQLKEDDSMFITQQNEKTVFLQDNFEANGNTSTSCSGPEDHEGNLLNSVVTRHNMTNCDDDYSPTLAICDIFNKEKALSGENETSTLGAEEEDSKDEFLIIDLDTCKMERASKRKTCNGKSSLSPHAVKKTHSNSPSKGLILVNLSSHEDNQSDLSGLRSSTHQRNFLHVAKGCDISYDHLYEQKENSNMRCKIVDEKYSPVEKTRKIIQIDQDESLQQVDFYIPTKDEMKNEDNYQNKSILFQERAMPNDTNMSNEVFSADMSFHSNDLNASLQSNENQECEPVFFMPELYTKFYDGEDFKNIDHPPCAFTNSSVETDGNNQYYEYAVNDNATFETSLSTNQHNNSMNHDFYEQHQIVPHFSFDENSVNKMATMDKKREISPTYGILSNNQETSQHHLYKNKVSESSGLCKLPCCSGIQEHMTTNPFLHSSYAPQYRAPYSYNNLQQAADTNPQLLPSASNYSDWNAWNGSSLYEFNLNAFASVRNTDSQYHQVKDDWSNEAGMTDMYPDPQIQADTDSEATEDADETDDIPIFLDNSTDFSACDNLSTMSVMSGTCYSDSSSVMTPISPSDFTPPPSASNTPIPSAEIEDNRFSGPFMGENPRTEPIHLFSPTMLSVAPYRIVNENVEQNLVNYAPNQITKRYYPSMADMHNSRSGLSISSTSSKFEEDEAFEFPDYKKSHKSQIQSDKISTSTSKSAFNKKKWSPNPVKDENQSLESFNEYMKQEECDLKNELRRLRHNEPLKQTAIRIMSQWYEDHLDNPYPTKDDKLRMARDGGITVTQVKSWFANKRNRTNNTKPKVQKRAMKEKLKKLFQDLKHSRTDSLDDAQIIQQLSGIIQT